MLLLELSRSHPLVEQQHTVVIVKGDSPDTIAGRESTFSRNNKGLRHQKCRSRGVHVCTVLHTAND